MKIEPVERRHYVVVDGNIRLHKKKDLHDCQPPEANDFTLGLMDFPGTWIVNHTRQDLIDLVKKRAGNALWYLFAEVLKTEPPKVIKVEKEE